MYLQMEDTDYGTRLFSLQDYDEKCFAKSELDIFEEVISKFKNCFSSDITGYSHKEVGFIETNEKYLISFEYAKQLFPREISKM